MTAAIREKPARDGVRRQAAFLPKTLNVEARTVEVIAATETPVQRWYGVEVLKITSMAIDASRLKQLPLLDSHNRSTIGAIIGRVEAWRVQDGKVIATVKFADTDAGRHAMALVEQGMIRTASVGYTYSMDDIDEAPRDGQMVRTINKWTPFELSFVSVPADHNATIRGTEDMEPDEIETITPPQDERRQRIPAKTSRQIENIRTKAIESGLAEADVDEMIEDARTADQARERVFDALADRSRGIRTNPTRQIETNTDRDEETRSAVVDELAVRLGAAPGEGNRPFAAMRTTEFGRQWFETNGVSTRSFDDARIADMMVSPTRYQTRGLHTTSDFPAIFGDAANRALLARYSDQPSALKALSRMRPARDFRPQSFVRPGEAPKLLKVSAENSEIQHGTLSEEKNGLQIETYARIFGLSRQAIINDDLGAFADFIGAFGESAAQTEGDLFFNLLSANSYGGVKLQDGKNLFHADHGNLAGTGTTITVVDLGSARQAMRSQKNVNGTGSAGAVPAVLVVGPALETQAQKIVAEITAATSDTVNPFAGKLRVEVENRYDGAGWWLFADPAARPALMHGYLDGVDGPQIETREGWEVLGAEFRCLLDFGCGVLDWRAAYFNPGE